MYEYVKQLWLAEEEKGNTTPKIKSRIVRGCGLLKKRKEIQLVSGRKSEPKVVAC